MPKLLRHFFKLIAEGIIVAALEPALRSLTLARLD